MEPTATDWPFNLFKVPLSLSILIDSPIRTDLPLSPVGAFIVPLVESNIIFGSIVIAALNLFTNFLLKLQLVHQPHYPTECRELTRITLTTSQLTQLITAYLKGQPQNRPVQAVGNEYGPLGGDEPLFPDNLSVSLMVTAPFAEFDGSPDTSYNVPLFEIPGLQGGLMIALMILVSRYVVEQGGLGMVNMQPSEPAPNEMQGVLRYIMSLKGGELR
ncbi:MAG: hypothetical protein M0Z55_13420 [Peptococcaceae bacterium]|nr:hypothetical protein [Peptococcaceae bacterium]